MNRSGNPGVEDLMALLGRMLLKLPRSKQRRKRWRSVSSSLRRNWRLRGCTVLRRAVKSVLIGSLTKLSRLPVRMRLKGTISLLSTYRIRDCGPSKRSKGKSVVVGHCQKICRVSASNMNFLMIRRCARAAAGRCTEWARLSPNSFISR